MKKIIDSDGKLFGKINIIDLLIIVLVIVLGLSATKKLDETAAKMNTDKTIQYTVQIEQVRQPTVDALNKKTDGLLDHETKKAIGDIVDIEVSKAEESLLLNDGTYKNVILDDKYDVELTMRVLGTETEDNYYTLEGKALIVGAGINVYNEYANVSGIITEIEVLKD